MSHPGKFHRSSAQSHRIRRHRRDVNTASNPFSRLLRAEALEDRRMLATITVTSLADNLFPDGGVTLREAVQAANDNVSVDGSTAGTAGADTILFDAALFAIPQTITLGGLGLQLSEVVTIDATSLAQNVTIDAQKDSRIFDITATSGDFTFAGLTLTGGKTTGDNVSFLDSTFSGGAIRSLTSGNLTMDQSTLMKSSTTGSYANGGGVFASGPVLLTSSTVSGNHTAGSSAYGGALFPRVQSR